MVSDHEIISEVLAAIARVNRGEASLALAGEECLRNLLDKSRQPRPLPPDDGA